MSNGPKQTLKHIINTYGMEVIDDQRRFKGLLMDLCGNHRREVNLLSHSLAEGAVHKLLSYKTLPVEAAIKLSAKMLEDSVGMSKEAALWAMETWAEACGLIEFPHEFTNILQMKFVLIPAGTFMMGSPEDEPGREKNETLHQVTISKPFYMQTEPVTQGQWQEVMGSNPSYDQPRGAEDIFPVERVSWYDVQKFIQKINKMEGGAKYRLPTEAQWEYACRAGSTTAYYFGNDQDHLEEYAWYNDNTTGSVFVGEKVPNCWGLSDMHGNVSEWVHDWYESYPTGHVTDPEGPSSGSHRINRGGSWVISAEYCRSASRCCEEPGFRFSYIGFRLLTTVAGSDYPSKNMSIPASGTIVIGRDGRFIAYDDGTVLDTRTKLMWAAEDNGADINWQNAKPYCENYRRGGYKDWRMPTQDELAGLYDKDISKTYMSVHVHDVNLTELIRLSTTWAWASETRDSDAAAVDFGIGDRGWMPQSYDSEGRALPVRSGK